ncbi:hypothetical protein EXIGLDRAFT_389345 [Exidia glandulosa HHB12029]|uniref:PPP4R2-domain-containing protein n=1 Tax=Exidia glandulosa HHB12029 TaxID=1314781 RepID=A0A166N4E9_EXIGL|nr:hypothetical protein EXIGLDRAFT_506588 [Exidia glandulosa HHB12029]KZV81190.1 hypothetical protein EXIGLDRAFT_389345 [Exidia glandulosa HHB12029]
MMDSSSSSSVPMDVEQPDATHDLSPDFQWQPEYDGFLQQIADTNVVDSEWSRLRDMIKYRINKALEDFVAHPAPIIPASAKPTIPSTSVTATLGSPSLTATHAPATLHGLVIPAFPFRRAKPQRLLPSLLTPEETIELKGRVCALLDDFDEGNPPFTIQRVCELALRPRQHYKTSGKFLRALERALLVTSTWDSYPPVAPGEANGKDDEFDGLAASAASLKLATTPIFSPIPFLHDDARARSRSRSRSRSPPISPLLLPHSSASDSAGPATIEGHALGLVDELDDPGPGHMADHPTALTEVTTVGGNVEALPLSERFVKADNLEDTPSGVIKDPQTDKDEDAEVEDMVLDDSVDDVIKS